MQRRSEPTPLAAILAERIRSRGPITFAEYMEACLYHREFGYYAKADQRPRQDYFTSVEARPLFGRLFARQLHEMWAQLGSPSTFSLIEAGAGTGELAKQILDFTAGEWSSFYEALQYVGVERSESRRTAQSKVLATHIARGHASSAAEISGEISCGCIFSNELLDAMPVHRVIQKNGALREVYVSAGDAGFCGQLEAPSTPQLGRYFEKQGVALSDEQHAEVCLEAAAWTEAAGSRLHRGFVLTIDYGHEARELYDEHHMLGTLLAYERHRASEDYFRAPGQQDLTAHVNFTAVDLWGQRAGLVRTGFTSQTNFLLALARVSDFEDLQSDDMSPDQQTRARLLFKTLINPEGMGETFRVLIQHKGVDAPTLSGFDPL
jgi:SAM-dependent MidA family methyltransferase